MEHASSPSSSAVWSFDLSPVTRRLAAKGYIDAVRLEQEFRRAAAVWSFHTAKAFTPSARVDEFWHEFVLDTQRYARFCHEVYGAFADHIPGDGADMRASYEAMIDAYRAEFGEPDPSVWSVPGNSMVNIRPRGY